MATNEDYKRGWKIPLTVGASVPARNPVAVGQITGVALTATGATGSQVATVLRRGVVDLLVYGKTDAVKLTFASVTNSQTIIFNGDTYTAHTDTTTKATKTFSIAGTNAEDVAEFASCVNDPTDGTTGVTCVDNGDGTCYLVSETTITAITGSASGATVTVDHAATYSDDVTQGEELYFSGTNASPVISSMPAGKHFGWALEAIADRKITLATVTDGQTVIINGTTFEAHTSTVAAERKFSISGDDDADAAALAALVNHGIYGIANITATADTGGIVTFESDDDITITGTAAAAGTVVVEAGTRTIKVKLGY